MPMNHMTIAKVSITTVDTCRSATYGPKMKQTTKIDGMASQICETRWRAVCTVGDVSHAGIALAGGSNYRTPHV